MVKVRSDLAPIFDLFVTMIRDPHTMKALKNWDEALRHGMLHFGRKEELTGELTFNLLIYTTLNPALDRTRGKIVLDPEIELVGVFTHPDMQHRRFNYLKQELLIIKAKGKWDYLGNEKFKTLRIMDSITLCLPKGPDGQAPTGESERRTAAVVEACRLWLVNRQLAHVAAQPRH